MGVSVTRPWVCGWMRCVGTDVASAAGRPVEVQGGIPECHSPDSWLITVAGRPGQKKKPGAAVAAPTSEGSGLCTTSDGHRYSNRIYLHWAW